MQTTATITQPATQQLPPMPHRSAANPWVSDSVLLGISLWWVQNTRAFAPDPSVEISEVFRSLQRDLQ